MSKRPENFHNLLKKHWKLVTFITFLPTIWFSAILNFFGVKLGLVEIINSEKELTNAGLITTAIILIIVIGISIFNNYYASRTEISKLDKIQGQNLFLTEISACIDRICKQKYDRLTDMMSNILDNKAETVTIITNPNNQLKMMLEQITTCLCTLMSRPDERYTYKDLSVVLAFKFCNSENKWMWLDGTTEKESSLEELTQDKCNSTFAYLLRSKSPYYFNNKKEDAKKNGQYQFDSQDNINLDNEKPVGSIFCYRIQIKKNTMVFIDAIISISTNQKRFVSDVNNKENINNVRDNMIKIIKDYFASRIGIELSLLYLDHLNTKK